MADKLTKFKNSDQLNASKREAKKQRIRGGAKNFTHEYSSDFEEYENLLPPTYELDLG
jgi:hypothetical protein